MQSALYWERGNVIMDNLRRAAKLLVAVLGDMDRIPVEGLDNQRAFLGCSDGIETVRQVILQHVEKAEAQQAAAVTENIEEGTNG